MAASGPLMSILGYALLLILLPTPSWPLSLSSSSASSKVPDILLPTDQDARFDAWCDDHGLCRVGVQTVTTQKSVGGRGLFATKPLSAGAVVASIPSKLVIPAASHDEGVEWQVSLTNQILAQKEDLSNEWIQSWHGAAGDLKIGSFLSSYKDNPEAAIDKFAQELADQGKITVQGARKDLQERIQNYERRLEQLDNKSQPQEASKWYTLVMSRAAYLGKDWDYKPGALPFFDMLNHCHDANMANTELMTFGDCLDRSGESSSVGLDRRDMLLVLTKDVDKGEELLTQYETEIDSEETQLKLLIQYGIPPP